MLTKLLIVLAISLFSFQLTSGATQAEAEQALRDYDAYSLTLQGNVSEVAHAQWELLHSQLDEEMAAANAEIDNQVQTILGKIDTITANLEAVGVNVTSCSSSARSDLESYAEDIRARLEECYGNMIIDGNAVLDATWSKVIKEYTTDYYCSTVSFAQCRDYEDGDQCYDFVISNIERATESLPQAYAIIQAEILNQIPEMNFPCRAMITEQMTLYPTLILDYVSTCVESISAGAIPHGC